MSKAAKLDHDFDIEKYTELLTKACGGRSQTDFAKDCGLSVAYICKYMNKKINKPPLPSTIKKIATHANGGVTYSELLEAAGYDSKKFSYDSDLNGTPSEITKFHKSAKAAITSALSQCSFQWRVEPYEQDSPYDLCISILNGDLSNWSFKFIDKSYLELFEGMPRRLMVYYAYLTLLHPSKPSKLSFVTDTVDVFERVKHFSPYMLAMHISFILIDTPSMSVLKEEPMLLSDSEKPDLDPVYTLK